MKSLNDLIKEIVIEEKVAEIRSEKWNDKDLQDKHIEYIQGDYYKNFKASTQQQVDYIWNYIQSHDFTKLFAGELQKIYERLDNLENK